MLLAAVLALGAGCAVEPDSAGTDESEPTISAAATSAPETSAPETSAPETSASEASAPETTLAASTVPTTIPPDPTAPSSMADPLPDEARDTLEECGPDSWVADSTVNGQLSPCIEGESIVSLQEALIAWGVADGLVVDGRYDVPTQEALLRWQVRHGWPEFTTASERWEPLLGQVLASLREPDLRRDVPCPVWNPVELGPDDLQGPHAYRPLLTLCDRGRAVEGIQYGLRTAGYDVEPDGYFGLATYAAIREFSRDVLGVERGDVDFDTYWALVGD